MLEVIYRLHVIASLVNIYGPGKIEPRPRLIDSLCYIVLQLPRADTRKCVVGRHTVEVEIDARR